MATLQSSFKVSVGHPILPGMATIGKFDGKHPALACGTAGNRVFVYSPHQRTDSSQVEVRFLNINRELKALTSGRLNAASKNDVLLVGSTTNVLAYDVEDNKDIYFKEIPDGVSSLCIGEIRVEGEAAASSLCMVGGNTSIQGFDHQGEEQFWTVAGDNVGALTLCDINGDEKNELIAGSDDFEVRIVNYTGEVELENTQTDKVSGLVHTNGNRFAYALVNGTVGVYEYNAGAITRKWRVKSKHKVSGINAFDINGDSVKELVIGWSNGRVEVRSDLSGEVLFKDNLESPIAGILLSDFRLDGREQVIVCSTGGEVRGYVPNSVVNKTDEIMAEEEEQAIAALNQAKQELLYEMKNYEDNVRHIRTGQMKQGEGQLMMLPIDTAISCQWEVDEENKCVNLAVSTNNTTVVRGVIIHADQLFEGESLFTCPKQQLSDLKVPICPPRDAQSDLYLKVLVGLRNSDLFNLFEQNFKMPKFSMYVPLKKDSDVRRPQSNVSFQFADKAGKVVDWLNSSFNISFDSKAKDQVVVSFLSLRDSLPLFIDVTGTKVTFATDNMELAGDLVQDLCEFTNTQQLSSVAHFPTAIAEFAEVLQAVDDYNQTRLALAAGVADISNSVKELVVRAEDSRILGDLKLLKRTYTKLWDLNRELLAEHAKRTINQEALLAALKKVNQMIQKAARLRVGPEKTAVIAACREAIKNNNTEVLFTVIATGKAP
mmetsp:Transcript_16107/g.40587  ORF Transcript_16107/g.40587 Transcript_16107/m.40587 type:complete len:715 (+) Transcript_16107:67-2211(+)